MNADKVKEFIKLTNAKHDLEFKLEAVSNERAALMQVLLKEFEQDGMQSVKMDGQTIYMYRTVRASLKACEDDVIAALKANGMNDYVKEKYNLNSLSARLREMDKNGEVLPEAVANVLEAKEFYDVRVTSGATSGL